MGQHKDFFQKLIPLDLGGVFDDFRIVAGNVLDSADDRIVDLLAEIFPDTTDELIGDWEKQYGISPDARDSLGRRRKMVLARFGAKGSLTTQFYLNLAKNHEVYVAILAPLRFIIEVNKVGDPLGAHHVFVVRMNGADQHRFPFQVEVNKVGDKLITYDKNNCLEKDIERLKPASTRVIFETFNYGFELNSFKHWLAGDAVIDSTIKRSGSYSARLQATGSDVTGPTINPIGIDPANFYKLEIYVNVASFTEGVLTGILNYYDNANGAGSPIGMVLVLLKLAVTGGFVLESRTFGQSKNSPDYIIPAEAKAVDFGFTWLGGGGMPTGDAYFDDIFFGFA